MIIQLFIFLSLLGKPLQIEVLNQNTPVADIDVNLLGFKDGQPVENLKAKTNNKGVVKFNVERTEDITFIFRTLYKGIQYLSDLLNGSYLPKKINPISVYDTKEFDDRVIIRERSLFFSWANKSLQVEDEIIVENKSPFAIVGNNTSLELSLPLNTHDLKFGLGFNEEEVKIDKNNIMIATPLLPGLTRFTMQYGIETSGAESNFHSKTSLPIQKISLGSDIEKFKPKDFDWKSLSSKTFDGKKISLWSVDGAIPKDLSFKVHGIPTVWNISYFIPFLVLFLLLISSLILKRKSASPILENKDEIVKLLADLESLFKKKVISHNEYQLRRLELLSKAAVFYRKKPA